MAVSANDKGARPLGVLELSRADRPPEEPPPCDDPAGAFLDVALSSDVFRAVVFVGGRRKQSEEPQIVTDLTEAIRQRPAVAKAMQVGFEVVFGVGMSIPDLEAQFAAWGYRELGRGRFGTGDDYDPTEASWSPEAFARAVEQAALHATTLCIFGHDWDPVYLLSADLAE
jgi:hypothetical protein